MDQEEKNKKIGMVVSGAFHLLLLLAFLFIIAWREPDPPLPEYGIELNFGLDDAGTGEIQPQTPVQPSENLEDAQEDTQPEVDSEIEEEVSEEIVEESPSEPLETTDNVQESPDVVEPTPTEEVVPEKPSENTERTQERSTPTTTPTQPSNQQGADGQTTDNTTPQNANQGDNADAQGDEGDEQGTLDSRALYGQAGGGGGSSLQMTGWTWDSKPQPNDQSNENGRIVFEIKIDDQGEIISVRTLERSVSPAIEKIYRAEVEQLTFSRTSTNSIVAPVSTGTITFVIKSK